MNTIKNDNILTDTFGRQHNYLRISLIEKCNLRCTYCMPSEGVLLSPQSHLMKAEEIFAISKLFVLNGVNKIRLTGGEPLLRKDIDIILQMLSRLNINLSITTNGVLINKFISILNTYHIKNINISLDTLDENKFYLLTRRNHFKNVYDNIISLITKGFRVKINAVLIKGLNEEDIINFIVFTENLNVSVRFIEFMPFDGNSWNRNKIVSYNEILSRVKNYFGKENLICLDDEKNLTARNFQIKNYIGTFGIISSITNPFCDTCNRIRLTADGKIKNCLFSDNEADILSPYRNGEDISVLIKNIMMQKKAIRAGMDTTHKLDQHKTYTHNRSMITIGG